MPSACLCRGLLYAALVLSVSGCSKNRPPLVPVSGKVQHDGKPVANATIQFVPDADKNLQGRTASGQTDSNGAFRLQTPPYGDGASPGVYRVIVMGYFGKQSIPEKYTRLDKNTPIVEIPPGGKDNFVFKLD